ncbi:MAG: hypothetical protein ACR2H1_01850 [Limisphaerales bacterium]
MLEKKIMTVYFFNNGNKRTMSNESVGRKGKTSEGLEAACDFLEMGLSPGNKITFKKLERG